MSNRVNTRHLLLVAGITGALLATSGCALFRSNTGYQLSPESRPLEVPPELSTPSSEDALRIPAASAATPAAASGAFTLADTPVSVYGRVGIALGRIDGVTIKERSQLLTVFTVDYEGESFLVRIAPQGEGVRISAASSEGRELTSGAAAKLLGILRQRLG